MVKVKDDLVGMIFGRLIVLEQDEDDVTPRGRHYDRWKCLCECGLNNIVVTRGKNLKDGTTKSCGCLLREKLFEINKKYNDYEVQEDYVIMYTQKGEPFLVDFEDFWKVRDICWFKDTYGYLNGYKNKKRIRLHRYIMNCPDDMVVDHINHDIADNRKCNLRIATISQNGMNKQILEHNTSGVTGVRWHKTNAKWISNITVNKKLIHLGYFDNFEDAVEARKQAEEKYFGEWSYDNSENKIIPCQR